MSIVVTEEPGDRETGSSVSEGDTRPTSETAHNQRRGEWLTLDRLPLFALAALLILGVIGAYFQVESSEVMGDTPFRPVWASYDQDTAIELVSACLLGLLLAAITPLYRNVPVSWLTERARRFGAAGAGMWLIIAVGGVALAVAAKGPYLFVAPAYLTFALPRPIVSLSSLVAPVVLIASGIVSARRPILGVALGATMAIVLFSGATRLFAGFVILFLVGRLLGGVRVPLWQWLIAAVTAALMLPIPLILRGLPSHGLIPYSAALVENVTSNEYPQLVLAAISENIGFTVPLLVHVAGENNISVQDMIIQLNPAPAGVAGWDRIVSDMRVHYYIPYSMLGEFASFGRGVLVIAVCVWGLIMRLCIQVVAHPSSALSLLFLAGQLGLALISILYVTQYNTRSVNRVLSMMIALAVLSVVVNALLGAWSARKRARAGT